MHSDFLKGNTLLLCVMTMMLSNVCFAIPHDSFMQLRQQNWHEIFYDPGNEDWRTRWFLDGTKAIVKNDPEKMQLDTKNDAFAVLWTQESFEGDLKIEYDFLRADNYPHGVNIIYIEATGKNKNGYDEDIFTWREKRKNAYMSDYFAYMNTYHISYATDGNDYVRGRRYTPNKGIIDKLKLWGTAIEGGLQNTKLFGDKQWVHITVIKQEKDLYVEFKHPDKSLFSHLHNADKAGVKKGRIGLRLMPKRLSYFKNISVSTR